SGMATATVASPAAATNSLKVDAGFDSATGNVPAIVVSGNTGQGATQMESAHLFDNGTVVLDTSATTGTNTIVVSSAVPLGHNNTNLTLKTTNDANGSVTVNAGLAVSGTLDVESPTVSLNAPLSPGTVMGTATTVNVAAPGRIQDGVDVSAS